GGDLEVGERPAGEFRELLDRLRVVLGVRRLDPGAEGGAAGVRAGEELEHRLAELDGVAVLEDVLADLVAVDDGAAGPAAVLERGLAVLEGELGVGAGDAHVLEDVDAVLAAAEGVAGAGVDGEVLALVRAGDDGEVREVHVRGSGASTT